MKILKRVSTAIAVFSCFFAQQAFARAPMSQSRSADESWAEAADRFSTRLNTRARSAYNSAVPLSEVRWHGIPDWGSESDVARIFQRLRDERFLEMPGEAEFPRRISWLYPDDGCYARAAMAGKKLSEWGVRRPRKLFVFGNLAVDTPNASGGRVYWWYHVVPAVLGDGRVLILDPSINSYKPLALGEWIAAMSVNVAERGDGFTAVLCSETTYEPDSPCDLDDPDDETQALDDQGQFLQLEWNRLLELGRSPHAELGPNPPWRSLFRIFQFFGR